MGSGKFTKTAIAVRVTVEAITGETLAEGLFVDWSAGLRAGLNDEFIVTAIKAAVAKQKDACYANSNIQSAHSTTNPKASSSMASTH